MKSRIINDNVRYGSGRGQPIKKINTKRLEEHSQKGYRLSVPGNT